MRLVLAVALLAIALCACAQDDLTALAEDGTPAIERGVEWVDVSEADPSEVSSVIEALVTAFTGEYEGAGFFVIRSGGRVAVYGSEDERQAAREIFENLAPAADREVITRIVPLRPGADLSFLNALDNGPEWDRFDDYVALRGTADQVSAGMTALENADVALDPDASVCETLRLYYVRDPANLKTLLTALPASVLREASVLAPEGDYCGPVLILSGPRRGVENIKRVVASLDVPQPEVRLDIWAFQISGRNAEDVADRATQARERIAVVSRLIKGYLGQLEGFAQDQLLANQRLVDDARARQAAEESISEEAPTVKIAAQSVGDGDQYLLTPSARGPHPLSLTETLAVILTAPPVQVREEERAVETDLLTQPPRFSAMSGVTKIGVLLGGAAIGSTGSRRSAVESGLNHRLGKWLVGLLESDPEALAMWADLTAATARPDDEVARTLAGLARSLDPERRHIRRSAPDAHALLPKLLLARFADEGHASIASRSITDFLGMRSELATNWESVSAGQLSKRGADAQVVLQDAEHALADDMEALFLRPLEQNLRGIVGSGGQTGLGSTSRTSVSVLSGTEAKVVGSAVSYFEVSASPELDAETLGRSETFQRTLEGILPPSSERDPLRRVVRIELALGSDIADWPERITGILPGVRAWPVQAAGKTCMMVVGTDKEVRSAQNILRSSGMVVGVQPAGPTGGKPLGVDSQIAPASFGDGGEDLASALPAGRLLGLAMALGKSTEVWSALTDGAEMTFTPHILPGGSAAEVAIDVNVTHKDSGEGEEGAAVPLSRVAEHSATTSVYVQALDLFALSSFSLRTSHPRPDRSIPVLGRLPFLGEMFRFPRKPATVHHESVLMVYSTILPTGTDLAETLDVDSYNRPMSLDMP